MSKQVVNFIEIMMRLMPPENQRFVQTDKFNVIYGGGEANVAVSCANYGLETYFATKLPDNPLGQVALNEVRRYGVKTDFIGRGGERLGKYFCESGASQRSSNVIYDRAHSAIAEASFDDFDWDEMFSEADWYHVTGITPALSENMSEITIEPVKKAQEYGVKVSCDLNYRAKLWSQEEAKRVMSEVTEYVDVCIANEEDAEKTFGIESGSDIESGDINIGGYKDVAQQLIDQFAVEMVGSHLRVSQNALVNDWVVVLYDGDQFVQSTEYTIHIVDRVGGGDSFAGGLIYSQLRGKNLQEKLNLEPQLRP